MKGLASYFELGVAVDSGRRVALEVHGRSWSFRELSDASRRLGAAIGAQVSGRRGLTVGVVSEKSSFAYLGMLGVLFSGNVYVPLDPRLPVERLARMSDEAGLVAMIADESAWPVADAVVARCRQATRPLLLDARAADDGRSPPGEPVPPAHPDDLAYLLFTSGSTGVPKGVPVTHGNVGACVDAVSAALPFTEHDRIAQVAELGFDVSIAETFLAWRSGAAVCVPTFAETMAAVDFVARHGITVWSSVPTVAANLLSLRALRPRSMPSLRLSLFCGEVLTPAVARAWQDATPGSTVVNLYGPTEASIFTTMHVVDDPDAEVIPIGYPLAGFEWRLDPGGADGGRPAPDPAELLVSGPQVVAGYWNDADATARAFVRFPDEPDGRTWYRTGDRVSLVEPQGLVFRGRVDRQVKIRGHRVELDEVEAVLRSVSEAALVAAVAVEGPAGLREEIVAYCDRLVEPANLVRERCGAFLPDYMLPTSVRVLPVFPLTANAKVDYPALAARAAADRVVAL